MTSAPSSASASATPHDSRGEVEAEASPPGSMGGAEDPASRFEFADSEESEKAALADRRTPRPNGGWAALVATVLTLLGALGTWLWRRLVGASPTLKSGLLRIALLGLAVRLLLMPYTGEADLTTFGQASQSMLYGGGPYSFLLVYPPAWEYYLGGVGWTAGSMGTTQLLATTPQLLVYHGMYGYAQPAYLVVPLYASLEKLPLIAADLLTGALLAMVVHRQTGNAQRSLSAFALWFLNPLVIVDSSIHGAFDILPVLLMLCSLFLLDSRRYALAGIALGLGSSLKVFPILLLPFMVLLIYRQVGSNLRRLPRDLLIFLGCTAATGAVFFLPSGVLSDYLLYGTTGASAGEGFWGFGVWSWLSVPIINAPGRWLSVHTMEALLATGILAALLLLAAWSWTWRSMAKGAFSPPMLWGGFAAIYASWLLNAAVHPQYVEWILPFLLLQVVLLREGWRTYLGASVLATIFYLFTLGNPLLFFEPLGLYTSVAPMSFFLAPYAAFEPLVPWFNALTTVPVSIALLFSLYRQLGKLRIAGRIAT